ncbi:hypothetical protein I79_008797 [Cricetulus griseus]|uniref:Uncharacterized protein n=1 Tax=Cricetulus griseus TaxID=10029 RepID=G3HE26_CRIGR|nr:hypothetical protein I79_008797 [Cricetulus griseus]
MLSFWLLAHLSPSIAVAAGRPYQTYNYTWMIINRASDAANASTTIATTPSYSPLIGDLCALALGASPDWGTPDNFSPRTALLR